MTKLSAVLSSFAVFAGLACPSAFADTFNFSFSGGGPNYGSGQVTTSPTAIAGQSLVTGISGMTDGIAISSLLAPGTFPPILGNDNLVFTSGGPALDFHGVSYMLADGTDVNLYYASNSSVYTFLSNTQFQTLTSFSATPAPPPAVTPEPGSFVLLGTGALSLLGVMRRRLAR